MCLTLMLCVATKAQDKIEYFWNTDPGMGNGTVVAATDGEASFTLSTEALDYGLNLLGIRAINGDSYSATRLYTVLKQDTKVWKITKAEYFWDTDPGVGNATAYPVDESGMADFSVLTEDLTEGMHVLGLRVYNGNWSGTQYFLVTLPSTTHTVDHVEYFWNTDPGMGNGISCPVDASGMASMSISTEGLGSGTHVLGMRAYNSNWSGTQYYVVTIASGADAVSRIEYFWDVDPGMGNGATQAMDTSGIVDFSILTEGMAEGMHILGIRAYNGSWSGTQYYMVTIPSATYTADRVEYFWDKDPGVGKATQHATTNVDGESVARLELPTDTLSDGLHLLGMRSACAGQWSGTMWQCIMVSNGVVTIERIESYWDEDPSYGKGTTLPFTGQSPSVVDAVEIDAPTDYGTHVLYIRALGSNGMWSAPYMQELCMNANPLMELPGDTVCAGEQFIVYNKTEGATDATTYSWDMDGDGKEDSNAGDAFVYSYAKAGSYMASLSVKTVGDCATTCYVPIVVLPTDAPKVTLSASTKTMCEGTAMRLQATATDAGEHPVYEWLVNDEVVATTTVDTLMISDLYDNDKVQVRVISSNPCAAVDNALSSSITIRVTPLPEVSIAHYFPLYTSEKDIILKGGLPEGGTYYIDGVEAQFLQISRYAVGNHRLSYVYTNSNGCTNEAVTTLQLREPGALSLQLGDVNKDETVDVMDILCEVDLIYGRTFPTYTLATADLNGDKQVDVADIVGISGIILGDQAAAQARAVHSRMAQGRGATNALAIADAHAARTTEVMLHFNLSAAQAVCGLQFDITLPEGIELTSVTKGLVVGRKAGAQDNTYTLLAYSTSLAALPGTLAVKATLPVGMSQGVYTLAPEEVTLVDASMDMLSCTIGTGKLYVGEATGMAEAEGGIQVSVSDGGLHIVNAAGKVAMLTDAAGRLVLAEELAGNDCLIPLSALSAGTYMVEIVDEYSPVKVKFLWK